MRAAAAAALVLAACVGCGTDDLTELVVVIDTDLDVPTELDGVALDVAAPSGSRSTMTSLGGANDPALPLTLSLEHGGENWLGPVTVTARGTHGGTPVVTQTRRTSFLRGERRVLELFLSRDCRGVTCPDGETCDHGSCTAIDVPPESLPRWTGELPPGFDGGPPPDGPFDAGMDGATDGGTDASVDGGMGLCPDGLSDCGGECLDTSADLGNCGGCGAICGSSWAMPTCSDGSCALSCETGFGDCNGDPADGCETDLGAASDCGGCAMPCAPAAPMCARRDGVATCVAACPVDAPSACGTSCVDTTTDPAHCGACDSPCNPDHGSGSCSGGTCALTSCDTGWADCNADASDGCETDLSSPASCGACGTSCMLAHATTSCDAGSCVIRSCDAGFGDCDGDPRTGCEQPLSTIADCGACGTSCALLHGMTSCAAGTCDLIGCTDGWGDCDGDGTNGCETDLGAPTDCGACGMACPASEPLCTRSGTTYACTTSCTGGGSTMCGSSCVDTTSSPDNCGGCGIRCAPANGTGACVSSACTIFSCNPGYADCNSNPTDGCEARLDSLASCGACGTACSYPNAVASCASGTCTFVSCNPGYGDCDGMPADGCEQRLNTLTSCGACGAACSRPNATTSCSSGTCTLVSCNSGTADCDGNPSNGCEDLTSDPSNCGMCGSSCRGRPNASGACTDGSCGYACNAGFADCDGTPGNGCECGAPPGAVATCSGRTCTWMCAAGFSDCDGVATNGCEVATGTNPDQCGTCGNVCPTRPNATRACTAGACTFTCNPGYGDCNGSATDGCETLLSTSVSHCGACGNACPDLPNSSPLCTSGACGFACDPGFADCNGIASDGCEVDTRASLGNCGACGNVCPTRTSASRTCAAGSCGYVCNTGYGDCNGLAGDGCEVNLTTNLSNCGMCANVCATRANANRICTAGTCGYACIPPYEDCNGAATDGCEANTSSSLSSCGTCGNACPTRANASIACSSGTCNFTCNAGYQDCNGNAGDGCEVNTSSSLSSCGTCGNVCPTRANATIACSSGSCTFTCNSTYRDCDGSAATGCEVNTANDVSHCGGCGTSCPPRANAAAFCSAGSCGFSCNAGFDNCNGTASDGCEASLTSLSSCGGCGMVCDYPFASESCATGSCVLVSCDAGYMDCNGNTADGCETNVFTDRMNCGVCGIRCSGGTSCVGGSCV